MKGDRHAGPLCGQLLGDMGADIVKIEPPGIDGKMGGDPMRDWGRGIASNKSKRR
jgi:crotonobetainyl-CoA:carnitine CoA-transferase CaiB-like acyl-CoA transferase